MKIRLLTSFALALTLASCHTNGDHDVEWVDFGEIGPNPWENEALTAAMTEAGALGPQHEMLAARAGTWKVVGNSWMTPDGPPMPMNATATTELLFGGRYIVETFKSDMMGVPYEGRLFQGYDNVTDRFWSIWTDNMNTGPWISYGTEIEPGVFEYRGRGHDVFTPGGRPSHMVITTNDDGSYTMQMFDFREGVDEYVVMELNYSRD